MPDFNAETVFAMRLRQRRNARGWSQAELAEKMTKFWGDRMDKATIARIETGARRITLNDAFRISTMFGSQIEDLLDAVKCEVCEDLPPVGFACQECGASREAI